MSLRTSVLSPSTSLKSSSKTSTTTSTSTAPTTSNSTPTPHLSDSTPIKSWEEPFSTLPLPGIRKLETQLRAQISEHRARLRSLVGAHYRDLLGTADRIVEMHARSSRAERILADAGARCNAGALERGVRNSGKKNARNERERRVVQEKVARAAVDGCLRIVRREGEGVLAGKMLVLGRLLVKSLEEEEEEKQREEGDEGREKVMLEGLKGRLGRVREALAGYISRKLGGAQMGRDETVDTLCAYALITSSTPADVLRFFLQVRLRRIEALLETPSEGDLLDSLDIYRRTLLDVRDVFPRRFAEGLAELSKIALVKDAQMRAATELSLDIYEQWIADDVRNFTPWFRHDQLSASEAATGLSSWAKKAQECLLQGLKDALEKVTDVSKVLEARHKVVSNFLALSTKVRDQGHSQVIDQMRLTFLARLGVLAGAVANIGTLSFAFQPEEKHNDMWDMAKDAIDLDNGALRFRQAIVQRRNGRDIPTRRITTALDEWMSRLSRFHQQIGSMSTTKWEDDIDIDLDELDDGDAIQVSLTKSDPQKLTGVLRDLVVGSLRQTYNQIEKQSEAGVDAAFLIRIVREVDLRRRDLINLLENMEMIKANEGLIESLHQHIAKSVIDEPVKQYIECLQRRSPTVTALWDGTPPLPLHSSPGLFRFLSNLHRSMSDLGNDLWSRKAVLTLQVIVTSEVQDRLSEISDADGYDKTDDGIDVETADAQPREAQAQEPRREQVLQRLFDVLYLQRVIASSEVGTWTEKLGEVAKKLSEELKLEESSTERLKKNATDYWRKTYLLFGLLTAVRRS